MKEKTFVRKRKWLNPVNHCDTGMISVEVVGDSYGVSGAMDIWDCSRKISLDFYYNDEKGAKQRAQKIDDMIGMLQELKRGMGEAYDWHIQHKDSDALEVCGDEE